MASKMLLPYHSKKDSEERIAESYKPSYASLEGIMKFIKNDKQRELFQQVLDGKLTQEQYTEMCIPIIEKKDVYINKEDDRCD